MIYSSKNEDSMDSYKPNIIIAKCGISVRFGFSLFFRGSHQTFQSGLKQGFFSIFGGLESSCESVYRCSLYSPHIEKVYPEVVSLLVWTHISNQTN